MTDQPDPASSAPKGGPDAQWSVEGATGEATWNEGMADTVVRLPKVPVAPKRDGKSQGPNTGRTRAVSAKAPNPPATSTQPRGRATRRPAAEAAPTAVQAPVAAPPVPPTPVVPVAAAAAEATKPRSANLRRTRKARLRLSRVDPWSVMKTSFLFSIAFGIMFWVSVYVLWNVVSSSGVFEALNSQITKIIASPTSNDTWNIQDYISTNKVLGLSALFAAVNVVLITALGTLTAFLYNLSANILGGLEVTLAEN
ncbi:transmembrane protein DUF3566 [Propionicimonas paludicola]|uniref:Transmembrane protein DUF3566 n=1 Tax=Propionicimonas paludicola TaxID=185243 RepID=A0A2A9CUS1_9ACTN|nr:DUF3566 domain-containing protein [Propionicimonas paludicola]PFG18187.1 transmembrane protein DUF3566 [Propionicimonas paludicola]